MSAASGFGPLFAAGVSEVLELGLSKARDASNPK